MRIAKRARRTRGGHEGADRPPLRRRRRLAPSPRAFGLALGLALASALAPRAARAAPLYEGWTSVRALGMGNAYVAVVEDSDSLFYNPAGLAGVSGINWTLFDPRLGVDGAEAYQVYQQYVQNQSAANLFQSLYGHPLWMGGGAKTAVTVPGFGVAGFANGDVHLSLANPAYPTADLSYYGDYGVATGFALELVPKIFRAGLGLKRVNRTGNSLSVGAATIAQLNTDLLQQQLKNRGTGYGMDLGLQLTIPTPIRPTLAVSWRDVGYTSFTWEEGLGAPGRTPPNLTAGAAVVMSLPGLKLTPSVEYRWADRQDVQLGKKIGLGAELELLLWTLRAGLNQGYYTLGFGMSLGLLRVDAATWGVELGEYAGQREERRYMLQMTMELGFDPFKFFGGGSGSGGGKNGEGGGSGGRVRLKQRR